MKLKIDASGVGQSKWYEYVLRFAFGGAVTASAGVIAKHFGPGIGGLFLAFPAILPATATLIEKNETEKKGRSGKRGTARGRAITAIDATGAAMGGVGLGVFALIVWRRLPESSLPVVLSEATIAWLLTSVSVWLIREKVWRRLARKFKVPGLANTSVRSQGTPINRKRGK